MICLKESKEKAKWHINRKCSCGTWCRVFIALALLAIAVPVSAQSLYSAAINDDVAAVRRLINAGAGANVNERSALGGTPLMQACNLGHTNAVSALINAGADVNARAHGCWTALMSASTKRNTAIVRMLIDAGANVNAKGDSGFTALLYAKKYGYTEIANMLINAGARQAELGLG